MHLAREETAALLAMGNTQYALKKLRRWKGEGPTERNRKMAQFLINRRSSAYIPSEDLKVLIDLALEWGDFSMWEEIFKKNRGDTSQLSLDVVIRAWDTFAFDRTKNMLVHSILAPMPYFLCSCFSPFNVPCRIEKVIREQYSTGAAIDWIRALQAHASGQDSSAKTWLKQQTTAVLSSIKFPPSNKDAKTFVSIAESEGLLFFTQMCVTGGGRNDPLV